MSLGAHSPHAAYLAAAIDGEGHVNYKRRAQGGRARLVVIFNTSREFIAACEECCSALEIEYRVRQRLTDSRRPLYELVISRRPELEKLRRLVPIRHPQKITALETALTTYRAEPPWGELRALIAAGQSTGEIAAKLGANPGTVGYWRRKLGLQQRPGRTRHEFDVEDWARRRAAGETHAEIAAAAGVGVGTVYRRLHDISL